MLTKKQLEDAAKCNTLDTSCQNCNCFKIMTMPCDCIAKAAKTALAYREMMERLEWSLISLAALPALKYVCPICCCSQKEGHAPDCELAALLKESEETK